MMNGGMMGGYGFFAALLGFLFLLIIIFGAVMIIAYLFTQGRPSGGADTRAGRSALDELEKRYARGEIGREEFLEKKQDIA